MKLRPFGFNNSMELVNGMVLRGSRPLCMWICRTPGRKPNTCPKLISVIAAELAFDCASRVRMIARLRLCRKYHPQEIRCMLRVLFALKLSRSFRQEGREILLQDEGFADILDLHIWVRRANARRREWQAPCVMVDGAHTPPRQPGSTARDQVVVSTQG